MKCSFRRFYSNGGSVMKRVSSDALSYWTLTNRSRSLSGRARHQDGAVLTILCARILLFHASGFPGCSFCPPPHGIEPGLPVSDRRAYPSHSATNPSASLPPVLYRTGESLYTRHVPHGSLLTTQLFVFCFAGFSFGRSLSAHLLTTLWIISHKIFLVKCIFRI